MAFDSVVNFGKVTVSIGYDSSAISIVLNSGDGAKLPSTTPYNIIWWNSTDYVDPTDDPNVEIVRVTARSTDTLTVTRAQEGTSASNKNTAGKTYKMILALTAKMITDIDAGKVSSVVAGTNITVDSTDPRILLLKAYSCREQESSIALISLSPIQLSSHSIVSVGIQTIFIITSPTTLG